MQTSVIYQGDNLKILPDIPSESVDLVYIDPPFNSGHSYEILWDEHDERRRFDDTFGSIERYQSWIEPRLTELVRVLKPNGSLYVHCDPHANYRIRSALQDRLKLHFRSEIVWKRSSAHSDGKQGRRQHGRIHDTIFFFTKGDKWTWNPLFMEYSDNYAAKTYRHTEAGTKRRYGLFDITAPGGANPAKGNPQYELLGVTRYWRFSREKALRMVEEGRIVQSKPGVVPRQKRYLDEMPGVPLQDLWDDIKPVGAQAKERIGYPTQKPIALLQRIIESSSSEGHVVLDAFCGCGTTVVAAAAMKRKWIGIDMSPTACNVVADRLFRDLKMKQDMHFIMRTRKTDLVTLKEMDPWDFQNWAIIALGGIPNRKKGADLGIDGHLYINNPEAPRKVQRTLSFGALTGKQMDIFDKPIPVQVKQKGKAGRPDVDNFQTALRRAKRTMGVLIAFDFTRDARKEVERAQREDGVIIHLFTAEQLLDMQAA